MKLKVFEILALFLYILCWFTDQPTKTIWGIGLSLPWFSLFATLPILFLGHIENKDTGKIWCCVYSVATLLYIVVVQTIGGSFLQVIPHLLCCASTIVYMVIKKKGSLSR